MSRLSRQTSIVCFSRSVLLSLIVFHPVVFALPALDQWVVTDGKIIVPCPVGADCSELVEDNGFFQQRITEGNGNSYYQHVLTQPLLDPLGDSNPLGNQTVIEAYPFSDTNPAFSATSLSFHDEHIIRTGLSIQNLGAGDATYNKTGVRSKTFIAESEMNGDIEDRFFQVNRTTYNGQLTGNWPISFTQGISQIDWSGGLLDPLELMFTEMKFNGNASYGGGAGDHSIDQFIDLGGGGRQGFTHQWDSISNNVHTPDPLNPLLPGGSNGGDINNMGDGRLQSVKALWVGQYNPDVSTTPQFSVTLFGALEPVWAGGTGIWEETKLVSLEAANPPGPWHPDILALNSYFHTPDNLFTPRTPAPTAWKTPEGLVGTKPHETPALTTGGGGPPIPLSEWTVIDGAIVFNEPCPAGAVCSDPVIGNGFIMREVTIAGVTYIQTIVTEKNASGNPKAKAIFDTALADFQANGYLTFADETFVRKENGVAGLSGRNQQADITMVTPANGGNSTSHTWDPFTYDTRLNLGWAEGGTADPVLTISQRQDSYNPNNAGVPGLVLQNVFDLAMLSSGAKDYTMISSTGYNTHYSRTIEGGFVTTDHVIDPFNPLLPDLGTSWATTLTGDPIATGGWDYRTPTNGGDIAWSAGDALNVTWVASNYRDPAQETHFSHTSFTNLTTGDRTALTNRSAMEFIPGVGRQPITPDGLPWIDPFATPTLSSTPTVLEHPFPPEP